MGNQQKIGCFLALATLITWMATLIAIITIFVACTFWTDRTLDCWCSYFAHHTVDIPTWLSFIVTVIGNGLTMFLNVISEVVRLAMGI